MLVVMTFNIGLICGVIGGYVLATLLMGHLMSPSPGRSASSHSAHSGP